MTGDRLTAAEAMELLGAVRHVVSADELMPVAFEEPSGLRPGPAWQSRVPSKRWCLPSSGSERHAGLWFTA